MFDPSLAFVNCPECRCGEQHVQHVTRNRWACNACGHEFTGPASSVAGTGVGAPVTSRRRTREALGAMLVLLLAVTSYAQTDPRTLPKLQQADLVYVGKFVVPTTDTGGWGNVWAAGILGISRDGKALYIQCDGETKAARFSIPAVGGVATAQAGCAGPSNIGAINPGDPNNMILGGVLETATGVVATAYAYYDANGTAVASHFTGPDLGHLGAPVRIGVPGWVGGAMGYLPPGWGAPAYTSLWGVSIVSRTSYGPTFSTFDPANLGAGSKVLVGYDGAHALGPFDVLNPLWTQLSGGHGWIFAQGSALVPYRHHTGAVCYGTVNECGGTDTVVNPYHGFHGAPYIHQIAAYAASDLLSGAPTYSIKPYAVWPLKEIATAPGVAFALKTAQDVNTGRVYINEKPDGRQLIVHVYQVGAGSTPAPAVDCVVSWTPWGRVVGSETACRADGFRDYQEARTATVITPAANGGLACPASPEFQMLTEACPPPPNPCVVNPITLSVSSWPNVAEGGRSSGWSWSVPNEVATLASVTIGVSNGRAASLTLTDSRGCVARVDRP